MALRTKVKLGGNIATPTEPPASSDAPQSPRAFTLAIGAPPDGPPELALESAWLHPAHVSSPQSAAVPITVRAASSMFIGPATCGPIAFSCRSPSLEFLLQ